jgi:hypothetical protein
MNNIKNRITGLNQQLQTTAKNVGWNYKEHYYYKQILAKIQKEQADLKSMQVKYNAMIPKAKSLWIQI